MFYDDPMRGLAFAEKFFVLTEPPETDYCEADDWDAPFGYDDRLEVTEDE